MMINRMEQYLKIIEAICITKMIPQDKMFKIYKDRDSKLLLFLLLKKYKCEDVEKINEDFSVNIKRAISYNLRKAEERFFINKEFREMYFEVEKIIKKDII